MAPVKSQPSNAACANRMHNYAGLQERAVAWVGSENTLWLPAQLKERTSPMLAVVLLADASEIPASQSMLIVEAVANPNKHHNTVMTVAEEGI